MAGTNVATAQPVPTLKILFFTQKVTGQAPVIFTLTPSVSQMTIQLSAPLIFISVALQQCRSPISPLNTEVYSDLQSI